MDSSTVVSLEAASKGESPALREPDGSFNSIPLYFRKDPIYSSYRSIGENFRTDAWRYRSCSFQNLCFDTKNKEFVIFKSSDQVAFDQILEKRGEFTHLSTSGELPVALGGINRKWFRETIKTKWFPKLVNGDLTGGYYELPPNTIWIPYHSLAAHNVGHLFWDEFFPIFKLLTTLHLISSADSGGENDDTMILLTKFEFHLWGTCEWMLTKWNEDRCTNIYKKFLSCMGMKYETLTTVNEVRFETKTTAKSKYVCSRQAAAGQGALTDHGYVSLYMLFRL
jgi:hypothetical protein